MKINEMQKEIYQNKLNKGFNVTDVHEEFCLLYGEVAEAYDAWRKNKQLLEKNLLILLFILWDYPKFLILI